jgi:WD40 repeat protein/beta-lactamase regulating signal transducer with metallopeptidase domain
MSQDIDAVWLAIGWTMLHFLWVGGLIAIVASIALRALGGAPAEARYAVALASLALLAAAPVAIGWRTSFAAGAGRPGPMPDSPTRVTAVKPPAIATPVEEAPTPIGTTETVGPVVAVSASPVESGRAAVAIPPARGSRLDAVASRLPWLWLAGSPITFAWLALGLAGAERLRRFAAAVDGELSGLCSRLSRELGIARAVGVAVCDRLAAPVLVGLIRPMILLPAAALAGWSPGQLEMILLHELVHVRRGDNLINLLQRVIESALFFHPGVWIVSGWVRREREHCCDAIVVARTGRARAYAESLLALAGAGSARPPRAAVAMAQNDLVSRVRRVLDPERESHAMKLPRGLLALTAAALMVPVGLSISRAHLARAPLDEGVQAEAKAKEEAPQAKPAGDRPAVIQGKTIDEWLAALKDRDPAVRERAVDVVGERSLDPAVSADERSRLRIAVNSLLFSDKDPEVRRAAAFFSDLSRASGSPERVKRALEERQRVVKPTLTSIRLVDAQGRPVAGVVASPYFHRDVDREPAFTPSDPTEAGTSGAGGDLALKLQIPGHLDAAGVYAIRQDGDHPLVGLQRVSREELKAGKPVRIVMHPACRVRLRVECPGFRELAEKYHADLGGAEWWRAAYVWLGENHQAPRPLFTSSTTGQLEFLLPPGRYLIMAYGDEANNSERVVQVEPGHRVLSLGVVEVSPTSAAKEGIFRGRWRSIRRDAPGDPKGHADEDRVVFRHPRWGVMPKGEVRQIQDVAYSPDGKLLATAHWYNADPGEVKLWDAATGGLVARLPVPVEQGGVLELAFAPDGRTLAGSIGVLPDPKPPGMVVLWDVAGRRELRTLRGHAARITALTFAPDGRTLASGGEDRTARLWDVESGREIGRVESSGWVRSVAYSPDGKALAIGGGRNLKLWDVPGNRPGATPQPEGFAIQCVAFAPDGWTLAAAGTVVGAANRGGQGRVRLYDLTQDPPVRRAELTLHQAGPGRQNDWVSTIAFTPDGRRVAGVMMNMIVIWDAATGDQIDSLDRGSGSSADRLAVSPDGRWLAITSSLGAGVRTLDISPTGP